MLAIVGDVVLAVEIKEIDGDKDKKIDVNRVPCFGLLVIYLLLFQNLIPPGVMAGSGCSFVFIYIRRASCVSVDFLQVSSLFSRV